MHILNNFSQHSSLSWLSKSLWLG